MTFAEHENVATYDWRLWAATTVSNSQPPTRLWDGSVIWPGDVVVASCPVEYDHKTTLSFNLPSVAALMLDMAFRLWPSCQGLLELFSQTLKNNEKTTSDDEALFSILQARMSLVIFSYTAIEAYANEILGRAGASGFVYSKINERTGAKFTAAEMDWLSLDEKLSFVIPEATGIESLKHDRALWQMYCQLRKTRHLIIHPKLENIIQCKPKDRRLWKMLTDREFKNFASVAKGVVMHFSDRTETSRWVHKCPW